nr:uncharacterized protein LOC111516849 [Leptinotarsa decemlineata]
MEIKVELAQQLSLGEKQVSNWFKNRRAQFKKDISMARKFNHPRETITEVYNKDDENKFMPDISVYSLSEVDLNTPTEVMAWSSKSPDNISPTSAEDDFLEISNEAISEHHVTVEQEDNSPSPDGADLSMSELFRYIFHVYHSVFMNEY